MMAKLSEQGIDLPTQETDVLVSVENISKKFCRDLKRSLIYGLQDIATEIVGGNRNSSKLRTKEFWALKDVSFQLRRGEALGLVGSNGAGKSTLLRIISGLIKPDTGRVRVRGRVAPLIALGAGFNPILTGRENIYANMSILGLPTRKIEKRFQEVVDFAEISDAIDSPVQTYSSGMAARLGFACAVYIEPDILLIDEVLAVGDIKFRMKCHRRLAKLRDNGTAFILVSHNPQSILNVCQSAIYLSKGQLIAVGETSSIMNRYEEDLFLNGSAAPNNAMYLPEKHESATTGLDIVSLFFKDQYGNKLEKLLSGEFVSFCLECKAHKYIKNVNICVAITEQSGSSEKILYLTSASDKEILEIFPGTVELQMQMPYLCIKPGTYSAKIFLREGTYSFDGVESFRFAVQSNQSMINSLFFQPRKWKVVQNQD